MIKLSDNAYKYESAGLTVNLIRRPHGTNKWIAPRIVSRILTIVHGFFHASEPIDYTIGMDSTYRPRNDSLTLMEKFFAVAFGLGAVVLFVQTAWFFYNLDRAFRAWLQVVR